MRLVRCRIELLYQRLFRCRMEWLYQDEQRETVDVPRRKALTWLAVGGVGYVILSAVSDVVSIVTNIRTCFTPPLPQRQAVELSGGTHHRVDAGSVEFKFGVPQLTVTAVRVKATPGHVHPSVPSMTI